MKASETNSDAAPVSDTAGHSETHVSRLLMRYRQPGLLFACCAAILMIVMGAVRRNADPVELELIRVEPNGFRQLLDLTGRVEPVRSVHVSSECAWSTRILSLVPEGTWVQKGDVVCVLDSAEIEEYVRIREVPLISSRAALDTAVQDEQILKASNERRLSQAQFALISAASELEQYMDGSHPQQVMMLEQNRNLRQEELTLAEEEFLQNRDLALAGFANERAVELAEFSVLQKQEAVRLQDAKLRSLAAFEHPRKELQLEFQKHNAEREILRTEVANSLAETRARLTTLSNERRMRIYERIIQNAKKSIEACTMRAPCDGQVLYANSWHDLSRGRRSIEEGASVYLRQPIFRIPDDSRMKVEISVNESLITRVSPGMAVSVRLKGYEHEEIAGEIRYIASYPKSRSRYSPSVMDYEMDVELKPTSEQKDFIRLNMDATVTLTLAEHNDALTIPREAIVGSSGQNFVWVMQEKDLVPRAVAVGEANDTKVCITSGLCEGDRVAISLTPQQRAALETHLYEQLALSRR